MVNQTSKNTGISSTNRLPSSAKRKGRVFAIVVIALFIGAWWFISKYNIFPSYALPSPADVLKSFKEEIKMGRLADDLIASLWRVVIGFLLSAVLAIPVGLWLGRHPVSRDTFLPLLNFFRFLSPLAWIPFAILWFHIGDKPAVFLIFMAAFFPLVISIMAAVATIPDIYFRVAHDYNLKGVSLITRVTLPAILPQLITALRVSYGITWVVIVAAEMVGCQDGLGYGIWEARNGLRLDSAVCYMTVIGLVGMALDRVMIRFTKLPNVRWGYDR